MLKASPSQILAMMTAHSEKLGSDFQKMGALISPMPRRMALSTPKSPASIQLQMAPTTRPGMTQDTRNRPRIVEAPGKFCAKNRASAKPRTNCPAIEANTKTRVFLVTIQNSGWLTTAT